MTVIAFFLIVSLVAILVAAEVFTNALEHLGERLRISDGVTGSLFAAVGTAMPETMVPVLALLAGTEDEAMNHAIGVGAIIGAPLMLSTLAFCFMATSVLKARGARGLITPERTGTSRDIDVFLFAFALAGLALMVPQHWEAASLVRTLVAILLVFTYFLYALRTLRSSAQLVDEGHGTEAANPMYLCRVGLGSGMPTILTQLLLGFGLLVAGAKGFIASVEHLSTVLGVSALLLSLLIIPIATELPEKVNSILWIRRRKDTLAVGNITGAMVFQGTLLPALGLILTPWQPHPTVVGAIVATLIATLWVRTQLRWRGLRVWHLGVNGLLYCAYLLAMVMIAT